MRLDDINAFVDAKRVYDRAYRRAFGEGADLSICLNSMSEFREVASLTDSSIKRSALNDGDGGAIFRLTYRNVEFWYIGKAGEVA